MKSIGFIFILIINLFLYANCAKSKNVTHHNKNTSSINKTVAAETKKVEDRKEETRNKLPQKPILKVPHVNIKKKVVIKTIQPDL
jgi:hypothetical protein